jgi:formylmethanofuran dehydrogenase subunit E
MATKTKARKPIMIFIGCWLCGETFQIAERDYNHGAVCGKCIGDKK